MATKKIILSKDLILSMYMNHTLEHNEKPKSVFHFSKVNGFTEAEFYTFFGTLESIEKEIFNTFFEKTIELLQKDDNYESYDMKTKLLSFYFTFFELITANRSYVVMTLKQHQNQLKNLMLLSDFRNKFKDYISEIITDDFRIKIEKLQQYQEKVLTESFWIQFLLTLKFWIEDSSPSFEKTDIYIEKSVKVSFELIDITPIDSLIDFGKFIFKEKINNK
ncbi:MAG TPA: TetR family transcriptional regulator C-terminal domain-containing protein [Flavobacterium sp.]|uniref:TetR family transcriptional regulator C-terminal domain-containing protein n=1 Tax=Flavobacterium sp. TaxID=239 RepID=UPI002DB8A3D0|nr:TetR family transcriptional regulator C-terminal domain-containing protein [Flavobacterium sp.]HEU4788750.1 TetR family transcriptional regulator C-terminal domain-containing protein [Flavobacterium sp.]